VAAASLESLTRTREALPSRTSTTRKFGDGGQAMNPAEIRASVLRLDTASPREADEAWSPLRDLGVAVVLYLHPNEPRRRRTRWDGGNRVAQRLGNDSLNLAIQLSSSSFESFMRDPAAVSSDSAREVSPANSQQTAAYPAASGR